MKKKLFYITLVCILTLLAYWIPLKDATPSKDGVARPTLVMAENLPEPTQVEATPLPTPEPPKPVAPVYAPMSDDEAKNFIYQHESGGRLDAMNSIGACGLGQSLPCSKMSSVCPNWRTDYACQDAWFTNYMLQRYGSWVNARAFWLNHNWW